MSEQEMESLLAIADGDQYIENDYLDDDYVIDPAFEEIGY